MNLRIDSCLALIALGLASVLASGCDPDSKEIGSTVGETDATTGGGESDGADESETTAGTGQTSGTTDGVADECSSGEPLVSGRVTREMTDFTWNEPFEPQPDAHISMSLYNYFADGPSTTIAERDVAFEALPFDFVICGDPTTAFEADGMFAVTVNVYNHAGTDAVVGDLIDEYENAVEGPTEGLEILVGGIEHCDAPNAGGICTTNE